jgi:glycosyltransferase involved in cell wall biosynthesis
VKPLIVSQSDSEGGAARAAWRLHVALLRHGEESRMLVAHKSSGDWRVEGPIGFAARAASLLRPRAVRFVQRLQHSRNPMPHSLALLPSRRAPAINAGFGDVVNLHWICGEMMSIADIGNIRKPAVWTLHDSWPFCGTEHHPDPSGDRRFVDGYLAGNRPHGHGGIDLDSWTWNRKRLAWKRPIRLISPSRWLASCARQSVIARNWVTEVIPNPLPTHIYRPTPAELGRQMFDLPREVPLVMFGAVGGAAAKGWDLLEEALRAVAAKVPTAHALVVGRAPHTAPNVGMPIHFVGPLSDDAAMSLLYGAADLVVIPSRIENLPQMGTEAQACGTPVVAFDCCGMPDVVEDRQTGYLARPYEVEDLARGIVWTLSQLSRNLAARDATRQRALRLWSEKVVIPQYLEAYARTVEDQTP